MQHVYQFLSLPVDLHLELEEIAHERGLSLSDILVEALIEVAETHHRRGIALNPIPVRAEMKSKLRCA